LAQISFISAPYKLEAKMSQLVDTVARQGFSLYDYLKERRRGIFNVLVASGFISYALLDHGLGRILLWSYIWTVLLLGLTYKLYYRKARYSWRGYPNDRRKHWRHWYQIDSWKEAYSVSTSDINLILGIAAWSLFWFAVGTVFCVIVFGTLVLGIGCTLVASFDFLWDWHMNIHPYVHIVLWWAHLAIWR
jgi:hypothetical protein